MRAFTVCKWRRRHSAAGPAQSEGTPTGRRTPRRPIALRSTSVRERALAEIHRRACRPARSADRLAVRRISPTAGRAKPMSPYR